MSAATRVKAYLTALAKTAGRQFDAAGKPVLTKDEQRVLAEAERADFVDAFRLHIKMTIALRRLEHLDSQVV